MKKSLTTLAILGALAAINVEALAYPRRKNKQCDGCANKNEEGAAKWCKNFRYVPDQCSMRRDAA